LPALFVHAEVLARFARLPARPWEVGGWLLGWWADSRSSLFVTHATPPASRGTPFGVTISGKGHRPYFDAAWEASGGTVTFLGDWHTHPGGPPLPSGRDRLAAQSLAEDVDFQTPEPLIAIVGTARWPWARTPAETRFYIRRDDDLTAITARVVDELPEVAARVPAFDLATLRAAAVSAFGVREKKTSQP
jgi:integrative and conjugative element protein (TIGR02256 family)